MIVLISVDKDYNNYSEFSDLLQQIEKKSNFREFCCISGQLCDRYHTEYRSPFQKIRIEWDDIIGINKADIKTNKWGKEYNSRAPSIAAEKACAYSTHIIEFGKGDYSISQASKNFTLEKINTDSRVESPSKRYNF
jgi:hypothetical protein